MRPALAAGSATLGAAFVLGGFFLGGVVAWPLGNRLPARSRRSVQLLAAAAVTAGTALVAAGTALS